jgi:fluoroquinolone resistance protein
MIGAPPEDGSVYRDRVFRGLRLTGALHGAEFHDCVFDDVDLRGALLLGCRFVDTDFLRCDLALASVEESAFGGVTIEASHAVAIDWTRALVELQRPLEVDFKDSEVSFATFAGLSLRRRRFEGCTIHEADFVGCDLTDASFRGSDLMGSRFVDCDLSGADLRKARAYRIDVRRNGVAGLRVRMPEAVGLLHGLDVVIDEA